MYRAFGLLRPANSFDVGEAARRLAEAFPAYQVQTSPDGQISVRSSTWEIELKVNRGLEVAEDSTSIAERIGGDDSADLALCTSRVEVWSETPDYEMEHFGDFQTVIGVLKTFDGVVAVNPEEPGLM